MTGKEWIENVTESLDNRAKRIERDNEKADHLRYELFGICGIAYDKDRVQTSCEGDTMARKYAQLDELDRKIVRETESYYAYRGRMLKMVDRYIPNPQLAQVITDRHIFFMTKTEIANEIGITEIAVAKRFNKAYSLLNSIYVLEKYRKRTKNVDSIPQKVVI